MFRTIIASAAALSVNAIKLHEEATNGPETMMTKAAEGDFNKEELIDAVKDMDFTAADVEKAIDWASENGIGLEDVEGMIEGAEASGDFDKHDIKDWVLEACEKYEVTEENLDEMLSKVGEALDINEEQGEALL